MDPRYVLISRDVLDDITTMINRAIGYCDKAEPFDFSKPFMEQENDEVTTYPGATGYSRGTMSTVLSMLTPYIHTADELATMMIQETKLVSE